MPDFRVALTGDFLGGDGRPAYGAIAEQLLEASPGVAFHYLMEQAPRQTDPSYWRNLYSMRVTPDQLQGVHGLIVLRPWVPREAIESASDLVVIGRSGAGYDKIDLAACTEFGVGLFNVPRALDHSTASAALMFMLALVKRLPEQQQVVRAGTWDRQAEVMGGELQGRTLGIVGLGQSGQELARLVSPFAMRIQSFSPHADPDTARALGVELTSLQQLLSTSDIVSLHARLRPDNHRMIGARELAWMKPSAYFVNVARGELIDQPALVESLRDRRIAGAALDVFELEPLPADDPLLKLDNVILTPHWCASTSDIWRATGEATALGMLRAARGQVPDNLVNPEVVDNPEFQRKLARFACDRP
jgi:phosphoglycerate dehydrogenase-like enzyme